MVRIDQVCWINFLLHLFLIVVLAEAFSTVDLTRQSNEPGDLDIGIEVSTALTACMNASPPDVLGVDLLSEGEELVDLFEMGLVLDLIAQYVPRSHLVLLWREGH